MELIDEEDLAIHRAHRDVGGHGDRHVACEDHQLTVAGRLEIEEDLARLRVLRIEVDIGLEGEEGGIGTVEALKGEHVDQTATAAHRIRVERAGGACIELLEHLEEVAHQPLFGPVGLVEALKSTLKQTGGDRVVLITQDQSEHRHQPFDLLFQRLVRLVDLRVDALEGVNVEVGSGGDLDHRPIVLVVPAHEVAEWVDRNRLHPDHRQPSEMTA